MVRTREGGSPELDQDLIHEKAQAYNAEYPDESQRLAELLEKFKRGTWSREDIEWVVLDWKLERLPDSFSKFPENDLEDVKAAVHTALSADSPREKIEAFTENEDIAGVGLAVATAIMVFLDPDRYTLIDQHAWRALRASGYVDRPYDSPDIDDYLLYLGICRTLAHEYEVGLRDLDRALWMIGRDL